MGGPCCCPAYCPLDTLPSGWPGFCWWPQLDMAGLCAAAQWQGGGGRVRMPPGAALELLHLEGLDLLLPHTALER